MELTKLLLHSDHETMNQSYLKPCVHQQKMDVVSLQASERPTLNWGGEQSISFELCLRQKFPKEQS